MYERGKWKDRAVEFPNRYEEVRGDDGFVTHIKKPGRVIQEGTPLNAEAFNHMEEGIYASNLLVAMLAQAYGIHIDQEGEGKEENALTAKDVGALDKDSIRRAHLLIAQDAWQQEENDGEVYVVRVKHTTFTPRTCVIWNAVSAETEYNQTAGIAIDFADGEMTLATAERPTGDLDMTMVLAEGAEDTIELEVRGNE